MNETAKNIISNYFGGETYVPKYLSEEGMECSSVEKEQELAEKMETFYVIEHGPVDDFKEAWEVHREVLEWIHRHNDYNLPHEDLEGTYEVCPYCGEEVVLEPELKVQTCPNCGKRIVACSMCRACDSGEPYCVHCCLEYQAKAENGEIHDRWG